MTCFYEAAFMLFVVGISAVGYGADGGADKNHVYPGFLYVSFRYFSRHSTVL